MARATSAGSAIARSSATAPRARRGSSGVASDATMRPPASISCAGAGCGVAGWRCGDLTRVAHSCVSMDVCITQALLSVHSAEEQPSVCKIQPAERACGDLTHQHVHGACLGRCGCVDVRKNVSGWA
eukprot:66930-Chlamydomonas_euryale.AAC.7